ncbi:MAG: hypothetical protein RIB80_04820 [Rhodospirillales bacterium]
MSGFAGIGHNRPPKDAPERVKDCYCYTCDKDIHHMGIMSHRAAHRRRGEDCKIMFSTGRVVSYSFAPSPIGTGEQP